jgi:putative membrane protein
MKTVISLKKILSQAILIAIPLTGVSSHKSKETPEELISVTDNYNIQASNILISEKETKFLIASAQMNLEEIRLSELAQQKSTTADVQRLGEMMMVAHNTSLKELTALAEKKLVTLPISSNDNSQNTYNKLRSISGMDFDTEYCNIMVADHKNAVNMFKKAIKECTDADIKKFAETTLPQLRKQLADAITCQKKSGKIEITQD